MICKNINSGKVVAEEVELARSMAKRFVGLMFRGSLPVGHGMLITRCAAVHTCFMRFNMDAVFLDKDLKVLRVIPQMRPWSFSPWVRRADSVLELPGGSALSVLEQGDTLSFS